ncbi:MAG: helix-turn-helix transcriptional regulator [Chloroflexaceae bacterium]|nr:helix-turn-helix transcriptional regulator [Chloroflexaceae bacterium]
MARWMLREIAEPSGWNPRSLATEARLSYHTVRLIWYNEAKRVDLTTLDKLAEVLKVPPGNFIGNGEPLQNQAGPTRSMIGICSDLAVSLSAEQIDEARREMWGSFYE